MIANLEWTLSTALDLNKTQISVATINGPVHEIQQCGMCDQYRLRSACAYAQSDQSLCSSLEYFMSVKLLTGSKLKRRLHMLV